MIRSVNLQQLPEGITFPAELAHRVSYAADRRQLQFEGFMSKTDFDKLLRLHNDLGYQRALEQLFQKCTFIEPKQAAKNGRGSPLLWTGAIAAAVVITVAAAFFLWRVSHSDEGHATAWGPPGALSTEY